MAADGAVGAGGAGGEGVPWSQARRAAGNRTPIRVAVTIRWRILCILFPEVLEFIPHDERHWRRRWAGYVEKTFSFWTLPLYL